MFIDDHVSYNHFKVLKTGFHHQALNLGCVRDLNLGRPIEGVFGPSSFECGACHHQALNLAEQGTSSWPRFFHYLGVKALCEQPNNVEWVEMKIESEK
ncbi:unnamed protein product [Prunus armeniaca]